MLREMSYLNGSLEDELQEDELQEDELQEDELQEDALHEANYMMRIT